MRHKQPKYLSTRTLFRAVVFSITTLTSMSCFTAQEVIQTEAKPESHSVGKTKRQVQIMTIEKAYHYKKVNDQISTSGLISKHQLKSLGAAGYVTVINLLPNNNQHAIKEEQSIVEKQGLNYRYIPVDFSNPTDDDFAAFVILMKEAGDKKTIVHCAANYRASAFFSTYAFQELGWSIRQVEEFMASIWSPAEYPAWQAFIDKRLGR